MEIYYDETDAAMDGLGWNVVNVGDVGGIAARFASWEGAEAYALAHTDGPLHLQDSWAYARVADALETDFKSQAEEAIRTNYDLDGAATYLLSVLPEQTPCGALLNHDRVREGLRLAHEEYWQGEDSWDLDWGLEG